MTGRPTEILLAEENRDDVELHGSVKAAGRMNANRLWPTAAYGVPTFIRQSG